MKIWGFLLGVFCSNLALGQEQKYVISAEQMRTSYKETVALVFNDESEKLFGNLMQNKLHLDLLCRAIRSIAPHKPKVIFLDIDLKKNIKDTDCLLQVSDEYKLNYVITNSDEEVWALLNQEQKKRITRSNAQIVPYNGDRVLQPEKGKAWLVPGTRVTKVKPILFPMALPSYFAMLVNSATDSELEQIDMNWVRRINLENFSEKNIPKVAYQQVLMSGLDLNTFTGKYVFVGVDQDKYDVLTNSRVENVNGVFLHLQFLAAYRTLQKLNPVIQYRTEIYVR